MGCVFAVLVSAFIFYDLASYLTGPVEATDAEGYPAGALWTLAVACLLPGRGYIGPRFCFAFVSAEWPGVGERETFLGKDHHLKAGGQRWGNPSCRLGSPLGRWEICP